MFVRNYIKAEPISIKIVPTEACAALLTYFNNTVRAVYCTSNDNNFNLFISCVSDLLTSLLRTKVLLLCLVTPIYI